MEENDDSSGLFEFMAVAALALLLWWLSKKKPIRIEPATTAQEIKDEFAADPDFSMDKYCQNVVYKPLSTNDLTNSNLLGEGWCFRGDRSAIDESKGFGDTYAEKQADAYTKMKTDEAIFINNKLCVQFRLINSTASPITTDVLNVTQSPNVFDPVPDAPVAQAATAINENGFTANWLASSGATGYFLDIATDISFLSYVTGYIAKDIGNVLSAVVTGLGAGTAYYYRVRAYKGSNVSLDSAIISVTTDFIVDIDGNQYTSVIIGTQEWIKQNLKTTKYADGALIPNIIASEYSDWFLPSKDELQEMYNELYLYGVGNFTGIAGVRYHSSSEQSATAFYALIFNTGAWSNTAKNNANYIRACRSFTSAINYSVRDIGPAGGLIFWKSGNDYLEAAPSDYYSAILGWSNVTSTAIGTTGTAIGTGQANTTAIINQVGHTDSSAKYCDDLISGGWVNDTAGAYCWYDNDILNGAIYGGLYNWYAVDNAHGLAPAGWRVPSDADFATLNAYLGGIAVAGGKLKEQGLSHWLTPNTGATDTYGFKALGSGYRSNVGVFEELNKATILGGSDTSGGFSTQAALYFDRIDFDYSTMGSYLPGKSIRCMRDI